MSTSYYIHKIPTKEKKADIISKIIKDDIGELMRSSFSELYGRYEIAYYAGGWQITWNPYMPGIKQFTKEEIVNIVMTDDTIIIDEYGEVQDKEEFLKWAFATTGYTSRTYRKTHPDEYIPDMSRYVDKLKRHNDSIASSRSISKQLEEDHSTYTDFINDGLRWGLLMDSDD